MQTISFEDFSARCREASNTAYYAREDDTEYRAFLAEWTIGGRTGGSCWSEARDDIEPEPETEFDGLDDLLESLDIRLRTYRKVLAVVERGTRGDSGYYGNWSEIATKKLDHRALYDILVEDAVVVNPEG